jgi:cytochrome P450
MMLATLFDYPWEDRRQLTYWSDVAICNVHAPESPVHSEKEKFDELKRMAERMAELYNERAKQPPKFDLLSMLAHGRATQRHAAARIYGQSDLVDRRRQRHDAQFNDRRPLRSEPASGRISEIAR